MSFPLALFPPNGLDRSLHTAVLIGLAIGTFFTETLGWTYAGLVVPGYLATVFFAAPVTGAFIVVESILTYLFVAFIGRWVTKTGAWSTAFGRERFYLFIVGAVFVRLLIEGTVVPRLAARYDFVHSRELYSVGLVLVPLVANAFWNSGLKKAGPRLAVVTALTALLLGVLLRSTNLSVSRFQVLNESLSLEFLESPKAHIILVIGALLGARNNVLYGWDYNGILVPGLLAVAWYEPMKLLTTTVEALLVYYLSLKITSVRPFSKWLLVGPRRMMFVYVVGFLVKMAIGFAAARYAPGLQMIDYFGFGYLLPSLLAVKMWNKEKVGVVIMPTLQVSFTAFLAGNGVGYAMVALGLGLAGSSAGAAAAGAAAPAGAAGAPAAVASHRAGSAAMALVLADTAPRPGPRPRPEAMAADVDARRIAHRVAREVLDRGAPGEDMRHDAERLGLSVVQEGEGSRPWFVLGARALDPEDARSTPRAAFRRRAGAREGFGPRDATEWLVLAASPAAGSALPAAAMRVAEVLDAAGVVLLSRHEAVRRHDEAFVAAMADALGGAKVLRIEVAGAGQRGGAARPSVSVVGSPGGLPVVGIGQALGAVDLELTFRPPSPTGGLLEDAPALLLPIEAAEAVGAAVLGALDVLRWPGRVAAALEARMLELTSLEPGGFRAPSIEELRLFDAIAAPRLLGAAAGEPSAWERALLGRLGYRAIHIGGDGGAPEAWGLADPGPTEGAPPRRGNPTWIALPPRISATAPTPAPASAPASVSTPAPAPGAEPQLLVEVPAPRWQIGAFGAALAIAEATGARALMIAGALPTEDPTGAADVRRKEGLRSYFQRWHELWIGGGRDAISVQAIEADRSLDRDVVLSTGREVVRPEQVPPFARPLLDSFRDLGLRVGLFDGTREQVPFSGAIDAGMAYAKRFAEGRFAIVYLGSAVRRFFELRRFSEPGAGGEPVSPAEDRELRLEARLLRLGAAPALVDAAERAAFLAACADRPGETDESCPTRRAQAGCDIDAALDGFRRYGAERNPYDLKAQLERRRAGASGAGWSQKGQAAPGTACHVELVRDAGTGEPWAIASRRGAALLLPLDGALVPVAAAPLPTVSRLRRAIILGTSALRVGAAALAAEGAPR